ncbi:hypothetical protein FACS189487_02130 [Campylobacterota bacterium]|nr:hypothetical protein FACS189487_02130 [Campylobacterota bacterium]
MKVWCFTIFLFVSAAIFALVLSPKSREGKSGKDDAQLEFWGYQIYTITEVGVDGILIADDGRRFTDSRIEIGKPVYIREINGSRDGISADIGVVLGEKLTLRHNAYYWDSLGRKLKTEHAEYNRTSGILRGSNGFELEIADGVVHGESFVADIKGRTIEAENIKASVYAKNL